MKFEDFKKKVNFAIINNKVDEETINIKNRGLRGHFIFHLISYTNRVLNYFLLKNEISFINKKPYIKINGLYFEIVSQSFLKKYNETWISEAQKTIKFIKKFKINPKVIIDIGSCWGEFSMILAKEYKNSKVYSIEGSNQNFKILNSNIALEINNINNIKTYNYIISHLNGQKYIDNKIATSNRVFHDDIEQEKLQKTQSFTLKNFLEMNNIICIDYIKIDIEGHEINLIDDLLDLDIKFGQIEIIEINELHKNINFLKLLTKKYILLDYDSLSKINFNDIDKYTSNKLLMKKKIFQRNIVAFDIYIISKSQKIISKI